MYIKTRNIKPILSLVLTLACLVGTTAIGADNKARLEIPDDFAYGATLSVDGYSPFYRVQLPENVYLKNAWADLRDVRVFNGIGQPLPISLIHYDNVLEETKTLPMTLFSLDSQTANQSRDSDRVASLTTSDGVTVRIPLQENQTVGQSYLLKVADEQDRKLSPERLILSWPKSDKNWQTNVSVYYSETTYRWDAIVTDAPLMDLTSGDERLLINNIELGNRRRAGAVYYLLVFKDDERNPPPLIDKVEAVYSDRRLENESVLITFNGELTDDGEAEYFLPTPQPLQTLSILPAQNNVVVPLEIEYRRDESDDWKPLPKQVVYQLVDNNSDYTRSKELNLNDRLVQGIRIKAVNTSWGDKLPTVTGERKKMTLIFNAQGNDPYLLAWGAKAAKPQAIPVESLIPQTMRDGQNLDAIRWANVLDQFVLGGEDRLKLEEPADSGKWQTFLLWAVLILGVAGLGLFAFKIWQEIKQKSKETQ